MEIFDSLNPESYIERHSEVLEALSNGSVRAKIPLISNLDSFDQLNDGQLVRFRGLVQNMFDPEIFLERYQIKDGNNDLHTRNGKYRDNFKLKANEELLFDSMDNVHAERRVVFMVSIPGLNDWAVDIEKTPVVQNVQTKMASSPSSSHGTKRSLTESQSIESGIDQMEIDSLSNKKKPNQVDRNSDADQVTNSILSREYLLNSPIVDRPSNACLVKFYENSTANDLSLNDMLDVIGFVSLDPSLCGSNFQQNDDYENSNEICAMNPPPSLVPRIHVISHQKLLHANPLLHDDAHHFGVSMWTDQDKFNAIRDLQRAFSQCLYGDTTAANYLLCHLISTVYVRNDETIGQFCLNITNFPDHGSANTYTKELYQVIESCLPASHYFPVTIDSLNNTEFTPTKDYETGRLNSGLLQLAAHTHLVLDETRLEPGKLENHGIQAVLQISNLIRKQQLNVNFKFYAIDYNANVPFLIFSDGKSMFPSNCHIPLKADTDTIAHISETFTAVKQFLKPRLNVIRRFLTEMRLQEFDMNPEHMQQIQTDFIEMRRSFNATADDLHIMLVLSRLLGIIQGKKMLDAESWNQAKAMESERRDRINAISTKNKT